MAMQTMSTKTAQSCLKLSNRTPHPSRNAQVVSCRASAPETIEYTAELRNAAISLHTREQLGKAPKASGNGSSASQKTSRPEPTLIGYLRFLQENKKVFSCFEEIISSSSDSQLQLFKTTGLERSAALDEDISWFKEEKCIGPLDDLPDGPGAVYTQYLEQLAHEDIPGFLCHYYNTYFAHMSGGAMIGKAVSAKLLDGFQLEFYKYPGGGDPKKGLGAAVKDKLNKVASQWTPEQRQSSVDETKNTFEYAGTILKCITSTDGQ